MKKLFIKNRKGEKIAVIVEEVPRQKGLVFVMHGTVSNKDRPHLVAIAEAFHDKGYSTIRFDTTNSTGDSEGKMENASVTNYLEDLEDVINWAKSQAWYQEPFMLTGHSLGGICIGLYAEKYPQQIKALAPISTVVSGKLVEETSGFKKDVAEWEKTGVKIWDSSTQPGVIKRLNWSHVEDRRKYDLLPDAKKLTMPVLLIVGELDEVTPLTQQKILLKALPGKKELHIIKGSGHSFTETEQLKELKEIFLKWIEGI